MRHPLSSFCQNPVTCPNRPANVERRLTAILAADVAGYSRLMREDEEGTVLALKRHQSVILPLIAEHGSRLIDTAGDGVLAVFPSVVRAVSCAGRSTSSQRGRGQAWNEAMRVNPAYSLEHRRRVLTYKDPGDFECVVEGLRKAGL